MPVKQFRNSRSYRDGPGRLRCCISMSRHGSCFPPINPHAPFILFANNIDRASGRCKRRFFGANSEPNISFDEPYITLVKDGDVDAIVVTVEKAATER
jgi:hypothetical protein